MPQLSYLDVVVVQVKNLKGAQICNVWSQRARQAIALQFQLDRFVCIITHDSVPITMPKVRVHPIGAHCPFPTLCGIIEFFQLVSFSWAQPCVIYEVKARYKT